MKVFGVDVSHWQGNFDFRKAKAEGVKYAIIKAGGADAGLYEDKKFSSFYEDAVKVGLSVGAYFFGHAFSVADAEKEADYFIRILGNRKFDYPVFYDVEGDMIKQDKKALTDAVIAFCERIESAGYYVGIYSSMSFFNGNMDDRRLLSYAHWVARHNPAEPILTSGAKVGIWQYGGDTNYLRSNRIAGTVCDQDFCYTDYPTAIIRAGLNGYGDKPAASGTEQTAPQAASCIIIGSARIDERGKAQGGTAGDQKQDDNTGDYKGEVSMQDFYEHSKGWIVLRSVNAGIAVGLADAMKRACNNANIGYDQAGRLGILQHTTLSNVKTECDCSSLVRQCFIEATGIDPGNFTTETEKTAITKTNLAVSQVYTKDFGLCRGDILVTKTKGHTAIVTDGPDWRPITQAQAPAPAAETKSNEDIAKEVIAGLWGNGDERKAKLRAAGYNPSAVQRIVNRLIS